MEATQSGRRVQQWVAVSFRGGWGRLPRSGVRTGGPLPARQRWAGWENPPVLSTAARPYNPVNNPVLSPSLSTGARIRSSKLKCKLFSGVSRA